MRHLPSSQPAKQDFPAPITSPRSLAIRWTLLAVYSVFLLASTSYIAAHRHFWFDEIVTFYVGTLPSMKAIWHNLLLGTEGQPIGFYVPVHLSYLLFGSSPLAMRLCAVIPFWLVTLGLYYAVARRTSPLYGFIAALAPPFTVAFQYSFEARPYALLLLFSICSFIAWQFAKEDRMRVFSLPAISLAIAAGICVHYNAILLAIPLLIGEISYTLRQRKIDTGVLVSLCASGLPVLFLLPHIRAIQAYSRTNWAHSNFNTLAEIYFTLSAKFLVLAMIGCAGFAFWTALTPARFRKRDIEDARAIPSHEFAVAGAYLILPIMCFLLSFYTKALHYRYVLETVIGLALFVPFFLWEFRSFLPKVPGSLCVLMTLSLLYTASSRLRQPDEGDWGTMAAYSELFNLGTKEIYQSHQALVLGDGPFLITAKYGSRALREKSYYLLNRGRGAYTSPLIFRGLQKDIPGPFNLVELDDFKRAHRVFMMYEPDSWLLHQLVAEGDEVTIIRELQHGALYQVRLK
jgi:Dolichyl-phosphate-mannose-protein mannosyltransferase